jgi:two-component system response regulator CpxR
VRAARAQTYDLVVLDGMLPDMDGFDVLRSVRAFSKIPVLLLTARGEEIDRIVGLEIGADDYMGKPFNPRELIARMRAIHRRTTQATSPGQAEEAGSFIIHSKTRTVTFNGHPVTLTDIEFRLLTDLLRASENVVDREVLTLHAFERESRPFDRSLDMHLSRLRKKLEQLEGFRGTLKSVRNSGYQLTLEQASVREAGA